MSTTGQFKLTTKVGHQRYFINSSTTLPDYLKCDGSIVSQADYPELYAQTGLIQDGLNNWTIRTAGTATIFFGHAYGNGLFIRTGTSGALGTSTDGITWTARTSGTAASIIKPTYGNGLFLYGTNTGIVGTSTDAITWTARSTGTSHNIQNLIYGDGIFVYAGGSGVLSTSTDGITWTARTSGTTSNIRSLIYANGLYIYAGDGGVLRTSTDAITWTARTVSDISGGIFSLTYGNGLYVCSFYSSSGNGLPGGFCTSTDAITWTRVNSNLNNDLAGFASLQYVNGLYICAGSSGYNGISPISTSTDAITWEQKNCGHIQEVSTLVYGNGIYVFYSAQAGGFYGTTYPYTYNTLTDFALPNTTANIFQVESSSTKAPYTYIKAK